MSERLSEPRLRIETGAHHGRVLGFDLDAAGSLLLTASDDKTARLWSVPTLRSLGVLHPPLAEDPDGHLYAAALSKDGSMGAVGGFSQGPLTIHVFDVARCQIVRQVSLPEVAGVGVIALRFSPDRTLLVVGTSGRGLMVISVADWAIIGCDEEIVAVPALDFSPDGEMLAVASEDGVVRLYQAIQLRDAVAPARRANAVAGQSCASIRFAPDGSALAIGFEDGGMEVREVRDLAPRWHRRPEGFCGIRPDFAAVAWCDDGEGLLVSGNTCLIENQWVAMRADARGGYDGEWRNTTREAMQANIGFMADLEPGRLIASRAGEIALYGRDGARLAHVLPPKGDLRMDCDVETEAAHAFRVSYDGTVAEWTFAPHWRAVRFDVRSLTLESEPLAPRAGLAAWAERGAAARVVDWNGSDEAPRLETASGQLVALALAAGDRCHAVDVDHAHVLLGASFNLYRFCSADGAQAGLRPIADGAWRVKQSPDGCLAVAALFDGTVRWFRLDDGLEELLAVFVTDEPSPRWVAFTPDGYYAAGAGADDLIGWLLDRGPGRSADFFPASAFRSRFHRPDVVKRVLATRDELEALRQADAARGGEPTPLPGQQVATLREDQPPTVTILTPREGALLPADGILVIAAEVRTPAAKRVQEVLVRVDGGAAAYSAVVTPMPLANPAPGEEAWLRLLQVALGAEPRPQAVVEVFALDESRRASMPAIVTLRRPQALQAAPDAATKPRLLAVLLGVTKYVEEPLRKAVAFASRDAQDMARLLDRQRGVLYRDVVCRCLPESATRDAVFDALDWLEKESTGLDTALLFMAGHGMTWRRSTYYFLLAGASLQAPEKQGLSGLELVGRMEAIGAKRLVMLDTCYAGAAGQPLPDWAPDADRLMNLLRSVGVPVFGATVANARAQERAALGNGVFTNALLKVLDRPDRPLPFSELWTALRREVGAATDQRQDASFLNAGSGADLALLAGTR
jgi:WD40 repeat protein